MSLSVKILKIMLALSVPACSFPDPQLSDRDSMSHQQPPNLNFPGVLKLVHTFSQASMGIQQDILKELIVSNQLDNSTAELRDFVAKFQEAVLIETDRLNQTLLNQTLNQNILFPHFLSETTKFTVLSEKSFQANLYECASMHGYLPYGMHMLHNVIDQQQLPLKIQISQNPIFRSGDTRQWRNTITKNSELCAIWQINSLTNQAEIIAGPPNCGQDLPSICLQAVGTQTFSNLSDHRANQHQLLASIQHLYYLLTQLETYPSPSKRFASDIMSHILEAFGIFADFIENKTQMSHQTLFASQRCLGLVQLALQKAQHSESWKAEERQQSNFEAIQHLLNNHTLLIQNIESRFQGLVLQQRQFESLSRGGSSDDQSDQNGSGSAADEFGSPPHAALQSHENDENDDENDENDNHAKHHHANDSVDYPHDDSYPYENVTLYGNVSQYDDNPHDDDDANVSLTYQTDSDDLNNVTWSFSDLFSWKFWSFQTQNLTETTFSQDMEDQLEMFDSISNESYPAYIYSKFQMVQFWPFSNLLTLAAFHLFNIVEFYINLLLKILALLLASYVFVLDRRVQRLEQKCDTLNQIVININSKSESEPPSWDPDRMKQLALVQHCTQQSSSSDPLKELALQRRAKQSSSSDPQCAQPLLATSHL